MVLFKRGSVLAMPVSCIFFGEDGFQKYTFACSNYFKFWRPPVRFKSARGNGHTECYSRQLLHGQYRYGWSASAGGADDQRRRCDIGRRGRIVEARGGRGACGGGTEAGYSSY